MTLPHSDACFVAAYPEPDRVRIVTTNFDLLFDTAARDLFAKQPDLFKAPALPLGREFIGIVHVHGRLDQPQGMVLTDADFGRAYLTDGWASRFLVELFRSTTVMFVGYSHDDTVMKYLARALPESDAGRRFILTDEADDNRWSVLGIEPVYFPKRDYDQLNVAIRDLAAYARRGLLDWRHEITEIARRPPSPDASEAETIREALAEGRSAGATVPFPRKCDNCDTSEGWAYRLRAGRSQAIAWASCAPAMWPSPSAATGGAPDRCPWSAAPRRAIPRSGGRFA